jgi:hypothetical protein
MLDRSEKRVYTMYITNQHEKQSTVMPTKARASTDTRVIELAGNRLAEAATVLVRAFQNDPINGT